MSYIDIIIVIILITFGVLGLLKGIIREIATLVGLVVGLYGAFHFSDFTASKLIGWVELSPKYLQVISFVVTFVVLAVLVFLLGRLVKRLVNAINLGFLDKIGGFIVGLVKGVLVCSLLVMLLNVLYDNGFVSEKVREKSVLYPMVEQTVPYVYRGFDIVREAVDNVSSGASPRGC